jgi:PAS domain S-box-containing protein
MKNIESISIDASHNGVLVIDTSGTILIYNQAARRIFNDGNTNPVGRKIQEIRPHAWIEMQEVIRSGVPQIGRKVTLLDVSIIANRTPIYQNGQIVGVISVFQDVSEHEKLISQLNNYQKLHKELEAIFESSYDGFYITDGNATTLRVNKSYERITGLSRENLIGRTMHELVAEKVFDHSVTLEVLQQRKPITLLQKIRGDKLVIVTGTPIFSENDEVTTIVTNVRDITELNELRVALDESRKKSSFFYQSLQEYHDVDHALDDLVVKSPMMVKVVQRAIKVSRIEASVLLTGESGVGKSMLAKLIHKMSSRKELPFVKINCGAIPASLMESELFGYKRGSFTGALATGKIGLIEAANKGTVFLDEIAELPPEMQVKLLEVIEDRQFKRVGATESTIVDVHIIAATNQNLQEQMRKGLFREDLFYRLNIVPINIPPLRERREDIPALAESILEKVNRKLPTKKKIDPLVYEMLRQYDYPGNVRELINAIQRMTVLSEGEIMGPADLPSEIRSSYELQVGRLGRQKPLKDALEGYERKLLAKILSESEDLNHAAEQLQIHPTTLWRKLVRYQLPVPRKLPN